MIGWRRPTPLFTLKCCSQQHRSLRRQQVVVTLISDPPSPRLVAGQGYRTAVEIKIE
ncbi:hypothetical protein BgiMline_018723, partial [Biomphalaria glabrata]